MSLSNYRELDVWQRAMELAERVYSLTTAFPGEERYGITSQLRRAAVSVPSNVAEGYGRSHRGDYLRFLSIARGSLCEVETLLILAGRLGYATRDELNPLWQLCRRTGQMLRRLADQPTDEPPLQRR